MIFALAKQHYYNTPPYALGYLFLWSYHDMETSCITGLFWTETSNHSQRDAYVWWWWALIIFSVVTMNMLLNKQWSWWLFGTSWRSCDLAAMITTPLQWHHNEYNGISNHGCLGCLLNRFSDADQRKHQSSASQAFVRGIHWWLVDSPHKGPVMQKMFPFDNIIMYIVCYLL